MHPILRAMLFALALLLSTGGGARAQVASHGCAPAAIDHVPIAVHSLEEARRTYERLGFRLKPGRPHANGLRNAFVKLPDADYLELMSAERGATDSATARYVNRLAAGGGGTFLALGVSSVDEVSRVLEAGGIPGDVQTYGSAFTTLRLSGTDLRWLFFIQYGTPVIDAPELLAHPNTAVGIETVWVTPEAHASLARVAGAMCLPEIRSAPRTSGTAPVQGVTLRVTSIVRATEVLRAGGLDAAIRQDPRGRVVEVPASGAHGLWIEFLEPADVAP